MKAYRCPEIAQLAHELTISPIRHRVRQIAGAARVLELVDLDQDYPYSFVCFHITGYRPRTGEDVVFSGKSIVADLALLMDTLTAKSPLPAVAASLPLFDADSLAKRFSVSRKTISRWRLRGLAGCWYAFADGKACLAFPRRSVELFVSQNLELVRRGASFQLMGREEKAAVITRARELVATGHTCLHDVTTRLAEETGRAVETLRYTLRRFDRDNADLALFDGAERAQPVDEATVIYRAYVAGDAIAELAKRFGKRPAEIRRLLTTARVIELTANPITYMYNESFDAPGIADEIMSDLPETEDGDCAEALVTRIPSNVPAYLRDLYRTSLLSREREATLFRRMNFVLHQAEMARQQLVERGDEATPADIAAVDELIQNAGQIKNDIIQANLRLVVSIAKRHAQGRNNGRLFELVSDGNIALMRAVEKFDYARGFRFSTYASWAISRNYARSIPDEIKQTDRFQTGHEEVISLTGDRQDAAAVETEAVTAKKAVNSALRGLDARERSIVQRHFGLGKADGTRTLEQIGRELGISKERARQIERRAMAKLRDAIGDGGAELLAG